MKRSQRKTKLRKRRLTPMRHMSPIEFHRPTFRFSRPRLLSCARCTSFYTRAPKPYLIGERNWTHPIQPGRLLMFL